MIAGARLVFASLPREAPGRPRKYKNSKEADHAYYMRHRDRLRRKRVISPKKQAPNGEDTHALTLEEAKAIHAPVGAHVHSLKELLLYAAGGNVDWEADVLTIRVLLDKGCDLEADILPTVARTVPELPRPLKNWGAKWLVREILDARDNGASSVARAGLCACATLHGVETRHGLRLDRGDLAWSRPHALGRRSCARCRRVSSERMAVMQRDARGSRDACGCVRRRR
jgi:hypothetical protein